MSQPILVLCDFDGTITCADTVDQILTEFAAPDWHTIERRWKNGEIGSAQCMAEQIALVHASQSELLALVDKIQIDRSFFDFERACERDGIELVILSDGLDLVIDRILQRETSAVPVRANHLEPKGVNQWAFEMPYRKPLCGARAANCKCDALLSSNGHKTILIGDGQSDICLAHKVDFVFAKQTPNGASTLLTYCRENGIAHFAFKKFNEISGVITRHGIGNINVPQLELHKHCLTV